MLSYLPDQSSHLLAPTISTNFCSMLCFFVSSGLLGLFLNMFLTAPVEQDWSSPIPSKSSLPKLLIQLPRCPVPHYLCSSVQDLTHSQEKHSLRSLPPHTYKPREQESKDTKVPGQSRMGHLTNDKVSFSLVLWAQTRHSLCFSHCFTFHAVLRSKPPLL